MSGHNSTAKSERLRKERNPSAFCAHPQCLWRTAGGKPCPRHPVKTAECEMCGVGLGLGLHMVRRAKAPMEKFCLDCANLQDTGLQDELATDAEKFA